MEEDGQTVLMIAAQKGHKDLVEAIVWNGYKINRTDKLGKNCLFYCLDSPSDDADVLEFLVKEGANLSI